MTAVSKPILYVSLLTIGGAAHTLLQEVDTHISLEAQKRATGDIAGNHEYGRGE